MANVTQVQEGSKSGADTALSGLPASCRSKDGINKTLEQFYQYIVESARLQFGYSRMIVNESPEDAGDLAQAALIALWRRLASKQEQINSPKTYIKCIVYSRFVDAIRARKSIFPLPVDQEGELYQGSILLIPGEGMQDPADEFERKELIAEVIDDVLTLPPCQRRAMICMLKDEVGDSFPLVEAFRKRGIDIRKIDWPREDAEAQKLRNSLSAARKKFRSFKKKYSLV